MAMRPRIRKDRVASIESILVEVDPDAHTVIGAGGDGEGVSLRDVQLAYSPQTPDPSGAARNGVTAGPITFSGVVEIQGSSLAGRRCARLGPGGHGIHVGQGSGCGRKGLGKGGENCRVGWW